jgi:hypothetical protein
MCIMEVGHNKHEVSVERCYQFLMAPLYRQRIITIIL